MVPFFWLLPVFGMPSIQYISLCQNSTCFQFCFYEGFQSMKVKPNDPLVSQTLRALNLFLKMILVCVLSPPPPPPHTHWILLLSRVWLLLTQFRKTQSSSSVCHERQAIAMCRTSGYFTDSSSTVCRSYTACSGSHSCERRASLPSPLTSPWWLLPYTSCLKLTHRFWHIPWVFFHFAANQLVENTHARTFSVSHNDVFCPLGSQSIEHNSTAMFSLDANMKFSWTPPHPLNLGPWVASHLGFPVASQVLSGFNPVGNIETKVSLRV